MEDPMKNYVADLTPLFEGIDQDWLLEQVQHHYPEHKEQTVEYLANVLATSDYPKKAKEVMFDLTQGNAENLAAAYLDKQKTVEEIKNLFADVDEEWLDQHYDAIKKKNPGKDRDFIANIIGTWMFEHKDYQKKKKVDPVREKIPASDRGFVPAPKPIGYKKNYDDATEDVSLAYRECCLLQLQNDFPWYTVPSIREAMGMHNNHYVPAKKYLLSTLADGESPHSARAPATKVKLKLLKTYRAPKLLPEPLDPNFNEEYQFAEKEVAAPGAVGGAGPALGAGFAGDDEEDGADIECTCCYGDYPFDEMVQCTEGHLFCRDCLRKYAEETVFGKGQTDLHCLDGSGCKALFPHNQLEKSLGTVTYNKIMDRLADIEVRQAGIEGLHQCPFCDYKAEINNPDDKVFKCQNPECMKESCRLCNEENHVPLRCEEVEKAHETTFRKTVEERMSEALVRQCPKCKSRFFKSDGCNKITCSCGTLSCYICREEISKKIGYGHFCPHTREAMHFGKCTQPGCGKCFLFLKDGAAEDDKLVEEAKRDTEKRLREENPALMDKEIQIGPKDAPPAKRAKTHDYDNPWGGFGGFGLHHVAPVVFGGFQHVFAVAPAAAPAAPPAAPPHDVAPRRRVRAQRKR